MYIYIYSKYPYDCLDGVCVCAAPTPSHTTDPPAGCVFGGVEYAAGETYKADCNTCRCAGHNLAMCTLMACLPSGFTFQPPL